MDIYTELEQQNQISVPADMREKQSNTSSFGVRNGQRIERKCYSEQIQGEAACHSIWEEKRLPILNTGRQTWMRFERQ